MSIIKKANRYILYILLSSITVACENSSYGDAETPLVTVGNWTLTDKQVSEAIPDNISEDDSITLAEDYVGRWVRTRLFLHQAEINLSAQEKDIEKLLDEYRTTLLVHLYQEKMLEEKHLPTISDGEVEEYYLEMKDNFKLQTNIIQGVFLKVPKDAPNQKELQKCYRSNSPEDLINMDAYALQYARKYDQFIEEWVSFNRINTLLPSPISNEDNFLRWRKYYETSDSLYNYYFSWHDFRLVGEQAPLPYVKNRIEAILLNKKRLNFIKNLGDELYDDALRDKIVKFH